MGNKNKIGIITFQSAINYGALLQTYSLQNFIKKNGFDCETINYINNKLKNDYKILKLEGKSVKGLISAIIKTPLNLLKKIKFRKFLYNNVTLSKMKFDKSNIKIANEYYDMFITGSDQVWNLELTGNDWNYYLKFVENKEKNSYAASLGNIEYLNQYKEEMRKQLKSFYNISIREEEGQKYLNKELNIKSNVVLDPVFLNDVKELNEFCKVMSKKKFILVYILHEKSGYYIAEKLAKKTNLNIVCLKSGLNHPIKAKYIYCAGIEEFLSYIKNAEYVITDSFHGVALSMIFRKNLKIVYKNEMAYLNSRIENLVNQFGLNNSVVDMNTDCEKLILNTDYTICEKKLNTEICNSKQYLIDILNKTNKYI